MFCDIKTVSILKRYKNEYASEYTWVYLSDIKVILVSILELYKNDTSEYTWVYWSNIKMILVSILE